ncbi:MAG: hypothetical protein EA377_00790 [Phycisphaerales bacterium]|nr:MAG: hypothetical protein EA377_00790 [Phycisphaerales bacterium]
MMLVTRLILAMALVLQLGAYRQCCAMAELCRTSQCQISLSKPVSTEADVDADVHEGDQAERSAASEPSVTVASCTKSCCQGPNRSVTPSMVQPQQVEHSEAEHTNEHERSAGCEHAYVSNDAEENAVSEMSSKNYRGGGCCVTDFLGLTADSSCSCCADAPPSSRTPTEGVLPFEDTLTISTLVVASSFPVAELDWTPRSDSPPVLLARSRAGPNHQRRLATLCIWRN